MKKNTGIYIHVPFCKSKCPYCDFYSVTDRNEDIKQRFAEALCSEIEYYGAEYGFSSGKNVRAIDTIYFGGGTPCLLKLVQLNNILEALDRAFPIDKNVEITAEANPSDIDYEKLSQYRKLGINRISLGVQSLDDNVLKILGRRHRKDDAVNSIETARRAGFDNISVDLMFGIYGQSFESWTETLNKIFYFHPEHLSFYSLEIMENTVFERMYKHGKLKETDPDYDRKMYEYCLNSLDKHGMVQYEISNASVPSFECRHNYKYWDFKEYLGMGPSSHSFMSGYRFNNIGDVYEYIDCVDKGAMDKIIGHMRKNTFEDNVSEYIFTGLRKNKGINLEDFRLRFNKNLWDIFEKEHAEFLDFVEAGAAVEEKNFIRITQRGMSISNKIMALFV